MLPIFELRPCQSFQVNSTLHSSNKRTNGCRTKKEEQEEVVGWIRHLAKTIQQTHLWRHQPYITHFPFKCSIKTFVYILFPCLCKQMLKRKKYLNSASGHNTESKEDRKKSRPSCSFVSSSSNRTKRKPTNQWSSQHIDGKPAAQGQTNSFSSFN